MSDNDNPDTPEAEEQPPQVEVPRPNIAAPAPKKRGRKPMPRDAAGNIIRDPAAVQAQLKTALDKRLPSGAVLSDENVGKAVAGAFASIGLFRGPHWRLFPQEQAEYGETFGPFARMFGSEELAKWLMLLTVLPLVTSTIGQRVAVERMVISGGAKKEDGRIMLLHLKGMVEAEKNLDIARQVKEAQALQAVMVKNGAAIATEQAKAQDKAEKLDTDLAPAADA